MTGKNSSPAHMDSFKADLAAICGSAHVLGGNDIDARYLRDWLGKAESHPALVVRPPDTAAVAAVMRLCAETKTPVIPFGGNSGLAGGTVAAAGQNIVLLSLERMKRVREMNAAGRFMVAEAGCIIEQLHAVAASESLMFPLVFGAKGTAQIGGALSTNAGGLNVVRYGTTRELTLGLEVMLMGGRVLNMLSGLRKDNTGYDLRHLFVGSEGTLGVITAATMKIFPMPVARATAFAEVRDVAAAVELLHRLQAASGGGVEAFELIPADILHVLYRHFPDIPQPLATRGKMNVLMEIASTNPASGVADEAGQSPLRSLMEETLGTALEDGLVIDATIAASEAQRDALWEVRETAPESHKLSAGVARSDISLPQSALAPFYDEMVDGIRAIDPNIWICGYGHIGDGNLHFNLIADERSNAAFEGKKADLYALLYDKVA